ncbi:MAG TPA: succinyl-diaminopimelate desuccinylase [Actinomycetes bacterium]|jgi:succinyl-diaminopimelate desuccinylase|nr:succinyl-diaminopimelate desuccinylase [Actinomycetes bacterium]
MGALNLSTDPVELAAAVVDIESVSGNEARLADEIEAALRLVPQLRVDRFGQSVVARTTLGRSERVVIAGHIDTVPAAGNLPSRWDGDRLYGLGACDMKGGVAIALRMAANLTEPNRDVTYLFYEGEEVESDRNGLGLISAAYPDWLAGDFAVLMEPSNATVEGGCQGTMRIEVRTSGVRAHSARAWMGHNAIHDAGAVLDRLRAYQARRVVIDGLEYREGLNAVGISGGVAGNVIPDECVVVVNYRFAPDRSEQAALDHLKDVFIGFEIVCTDSAAGALPGLDRPSAAAFVTAMGGPPRAKLGWTDVARFSALGMPAVNFGPGDPELAHSKDEYVEISQIYHCADRLQAWLVD